ncbi:MAG: dinitrogenase iron-molybdenum cofactor biosynthesis protein [Candidatus Lokiarchaeota archaeon]|nr:dinitrogenase iron-molybdenum cofactor biosynthesis protein [Candidatus Lokiarchaeota archaeon]
MQSEKVAVPASELTGLDSQVSSHFGHCPAFVVSTIEDGKIVDVETIENSSHRSCAEPVMLLADRGVKVLLATGMGGRPYMISQQVGISVMKAVGSTVREVIDNYLKGNGTLFGDESLCGGGKQH